MDRSATGSCFGFGGGPKMGFFWTRGDTRGIILTRVANLSSWDVSM